VVTLFPELFPGPLAASLAGEALKAGVWSLDTIAIRDFGIGKHRAVDDTPAGGGAGMVMRADVLAAAIDAARARHGDLPAICFTPRGVPFTQAIARELAAGPGALLVAGRFEGIDERVIEGRALREVSVGDYVLSGGEIAAMALIDAIVRLLPGALNDAQSATQESFVTGLLDCPHYTRPEAYEGERVPEVLLSGHHAEIERWRLKQALGRTWLRRPDLLAKRALSEPEQKLLAEFRAEHERSE
jgi:tRNA (guanine37-N1)-methyltransferase